jgi:hypothetical protein
VHYAILSQQHLTEQSTTGLQNRLIDVWNQRLF